MHVSTDPVAETLNQAANKIETAGWVQGTAFSDDGAVCADRAISDAARSHNNYREAWLRFFKVHGVTPALFNDADGRTQDEVTTALRLAAK